MLSPLVAYMATAGISVTAFMAIISTHRVQATTTFIKASRENEEDAWLGDKTVGNASQGWHIMIGPLLSLPET